MWRDRQNPWVTFLFVCPHPCRLHLLFCYLNRLQGQIHVCGLWTQWSFLSYWIDDYSHVCFPTHQQFTQSCRHPNRPKDNAGLSCLVKCFCLWLQLEIRFHLVVIEAGGLHFFICMPGVVLYVKDLFAPLVTLWQRQYAMFLSQKI